MKPYIFWLAIVVFAAPGCSVFMEANRPTPTNLHKFEAGQSRNSVRQQLGAPDVSTLQADGMNCDVYHLYTRGYGAEGKAGIAFLEGTADVLSLGLTEIVLTPTEALTRNKKHPVTFCYSSGRLVRVKPGVVASSDTAFQKRAVVQQRSKPPPAAPVPKPRHALEQPIPVKPAAAPPLPPTVVVPAS
ncbi:MAG: hypothetical protein ACREP6_04470 [Candidatus Binataceae bacterium]